jgi:hypothetical protein
MNIALEDTLSKSTIDKCPYCRLDFSNSFCTDIVANIEAHLEHKIEPNEEEPLQWMKAPNVRLAALNMLAKLPKETPLGRPIASAVMRSSLDSSPGIANAALSTERLSVAIEVVSEEHAEMFQMHCRAVLKSLNTAEADATRPHMASVIAQLTESNRGCVAVVESGGCGAMVQALKVAVTDEVIGSIALAIQHLVENSDCGIRCFRQFSEHSVCSYLAAALAIQPSTLIQSSPSFSANLHPPLPHTFVHPPPTLSTLNPQPSTLISPSPSFSANLHPLSPTHSYTLLPPSPPFTLNPHLNLSFLSPLNSKSPPYPPPTQHPPPTLSTLNPPTLSTLNPHRV